MKVGEGGGLLIRAQVGKLHFPYGMGISDSLDRGMRPVGIILTDLDRWKPIHVSVSAESITTRVPLSPLAHGNRILSHRPPRFGQSNCTPLALSPVLSGQLRPSEADEPPFIDRKF